MFQRNILGAEDAVLLAGMGASLAMKECAEEETGMGQHSRRSFIVRGGVAAAEVAVTTSLTRRIWADSFESRLGIQLYSVAAQLKSDLPGTMRALRAMGYRNVESAGFMGLTVAAFRAALDDAGLRCPSSHLDFNGVGPSDLGPLFDDAHTVGAHYVVSSLLLPPGMRGSIDQAELSSITLDDFKRTAHLANRVAAQAKRAGLQYAYHNHDYEFRDQGNGATGYDLLLKETDPSLVKFELDCGWMVIAGRNPVDYFRRYPHRYRMLHIKDFAKGGKITTDLMGPNRPVGTELGRGFIDYKPIFAAARKIGIAYFFSEQEPPVVGMTELQAAKINLEYMEAM